MRESGQAAVELVVVLPILAVVALAIVQAGLVVRDHVLVVHAAREAARTAAVDADPEAPRRAAAAAGRLNADRLEVSVVGRRRPGRPLTVEVRYRSPTEVPIVGRLVADVVLTTRAAMRVEGW